LEFIEQTSSKNMPKICVIGAGVVGMSSAVQIAEKYGRNVQVTVITDQVTPNTTVRVLILSMY
jgi:glycine/D-amino acid oxidase-like deaminating enzyme